MGRRANQVWAQRRLSDRAATKTVGERLNQERRRRLFSKHRKFHSKAR